LFGSGFLHLCLQQWFFLKKQILTFSAIDQQSLIGYAFKLNDIFIYYLKYPTNKDVEMPVLVLSIDFDGCLAHSEFSQSADCDLLKANQPFLHYLSHLCLGFDKKILFSGSSRQSSFIDFMSQKSNRQLLRSFPYYLKVAAYLGISFDALLMADVYSNFAPGTAYNLELAMHYPFKDKDDFSKNYMQILEFQASLRCPKPPDAFCDTSKVSLLYAQMHKVAQTYPASEITFKFFDDDRKYLTNIHEVFKNHPNLIPSNLRLDLGHYDGEEFKDFNSVQGQGNLDEDYYQTLSDIKQSAHLSNWENNKNLSLLFNHRLVEAIDQRLSEDSETRQGFEEQTDLINSFMVLYQKAKVLAKRQEHLAADAAFLLHRELTHSLYQYQRQEIPLDQFVQSCQNSIAKCRPILAQHRGWKEILFNLMAAVLMFGGLGYMLAAAIKRDLLLFKFKTDSVQKIEKIEDSLDRMKSEFEGC
jgi:hypothetical protein